MEALIIALALGLFWFSGRGGPTLPPVSVSLKAVDSLAGPIESGSRAYPPADMTIVQGQTVRFIHTAYYQPSASAVVNIPGQVLLRTQTLKGSFWGDWGDMRGPASPDDPYIDAMFDHWPGVYRVSARVPASADHQGGEVNGWIIIEVV